jgi:hypothetical protein
MLLPYCAVRIKMYKALEDIERIDSEPDVGNLSNMNQNATKVRILINSTSEIS